MRSTALVVLAGGIAACFAQPPAPAMPPDGATGSGGDAIGSSACPDGQQPVMFEGFDESAATGSAACGSAGGNVTADVTCGSLVRSNNVLAYTGTSSQACQATCTWNALPAQNGVILQWTLLQVGNGADTTSMTVSWTVSTSRTTGLQLELGPQIDFESNGISRLRTSTDLSNAWWRIAPATSSAMGGWFSADGMTWGSAGTDPGTPPAAIGTLTIHFESADANQVKLDTIYLCP